MKLTKLILGLGTNIRFSQHSKKVRIVFYMVYIERDLSKAKVNKEIAVLLTDQLSANKNQKLLLSLRIRRPVHLKSQ